MFLFMYLFFKRPTYLSCFGAVVGLFAAHRLSLVAVNRGYSLSVVHGLLIVVPSLVAEHGLYEHRL